MIEYLIYGKKTTHDVIYNITYTSKYALCYKIMAVIMSFYREYFFGSFEIVIIIIIFKYSFLPKLLLYYYFQKKKKILFRNILL